MNKIKQHIYKAMLWLLPWMCAVPLASCSFDDDIDTGDDNAPAMLQLSITAREEGDLNTREGTEVGQNSEYMHNLLVLFIQGDKVVKKFLPDLSNDEAAKVGNLKTWTSENFTLTPGTYTVYAFANIDSYFSTAWSSLTGLGTDEGKSLSDLGVDINNIVLEDNPASKLDLLTYFIPMSAKEEVTVTRSTRNISIGLDRLVSKIRMSITGKPDTKVTALSFGGYADKIGLFSDKILDGEAYTTTKTINIPGDGTLKADGTGTTGTLVIPDFYVNSSPVGHPFTVKIKTVEATGIIHDATAVTQRNELPRNSIFPLTLQLNDYGLDLEAQCWVSPIGSLPVEVSVGFTQDTYEITVPEGCQFEFTVNGINGATAGVTDLSCTWNMPDGVSGIAFDGETTGVTTVKGHVTASAGKTFDLSLLVTWKDNGATYNRTYTVKVLTDDITNFPFKSKTRTPEFGLDYLRHEMLNMFIK